MELPYLFTFRDTTKTRERVWKVLPRKASHAPIFRWCTCNSLTREVADTNSLTQVADNMQIRYGRLNKRYTSFLTIFYKMEA